MAILDFERLLRYGYFPKELPPCFITSDFSAQSTTVKNHINSNLTNKSRSIPLTYSGFKSENARRKFAIPNPFFFSKAALNIVNGESELKKVFSKSKYSLRAPINGTPQKGDSYAMRSSKHADTKYEVEKLFQNKKIEIRLDINSCFDSIYTHTIPWAIHGVDVSKKHPKDTSLLGNIIDGSMQAMNYGQTNGVLVGNDLSRIVSEIILCTVDEQIQKKFPEVSCCRFVDDYYIYIHNSGSVQEIIAFIRLALSKYELNINENKLQINENPFLYDKPWVIDMQEVLKLKPGDFLSWIISRYLVEKDPALLKYGLKVIDAKCYYSKKSWEIMQSRIINVWVRYPFLAERILPLLWNNEDKINKRELKRAIYSVIDQTILLKQDLELIWAVWFLKTFDIKISKDYAIKVFKSDNDLAIIILLDILKKYGMDLNSDIQKEYKELLKKLHDSGLDYELKAGNLPWSSHWLLAYEAEREKVFSIIGSNFDYMKKVPFFEELLNSNVKFYDSTYAYSKNQFVKKVSKTKSLEKMKEKMVADSIKEAIEEDDKELTLRFLQMLEEDLGDY